MIFAIQNYVLDQKSHNYSLILFGPNALGPNNINVFVTSSLFGPNAFGPIRSYENITLLIRGFLFGISRNPRINVRKWLMVLKSFNTSEITTCVKQSGCCLCLTAASTLTAFIGSVAIEPINAPKY